MIEVHIVEGVTFVTISERSYFSGKVRVNAGTPFTPNKKTIVPAPVTSIEKVVTGKRLDHYVAEDGRTLSVEDYKTTLLKLREGGEYFEDTYNWIFETLTQKRDYDNFIAAYKGVMVEEITYEPVEWETYQHGSSDNDLIIPLRMLGELKPLYSYTTSWIRLYHEIGSKYGFSYVDKSEDESKKEWSSASHSQDTAQYSKIAGNYVKNYRKQKRISAGTYAECEAAYQSDYKLVDIEFKTALARVEGKQPTNLADLISKSCIMLDRINKIDYMKRGYDDWRYAKNYCVELINLLEDQL